MPNRHSPDPDLIRATDLFPELDRDIDRRIAHSEMRIKYWVIAGVVANLFALLLGGIPTVYFLGQMSEKMSTAIVAVQASQTELNVRGKWMQDREMWEADMETHFGYRPEIPSRIRPKMGNE